MQELFAQIQNLTIDREYSIKPEIFGLIYCPIKSLQVEVTEEMLHIISGLEELSVKKEVEMEIFATPFQDKRFTI